MHQEEARTESGASSQVNRVSWIDKEGEILSEFEKFHQGMRAPGNGSE